MRMLARRMTNDCTSTHPETDLSNYNQLNYTVRIPREDWGIGKIRGITPPKNPINECWHVMFADLKENPSTKTQANGIDVE